MRIHNNERPFECEVCGRKFREKKVMKKHEALHTSERKYKCDVCGRGFLRQSNLDLHAVMHQKGLKDSALRRVRPQPRRRAVDVEMREFVANVLCNVGKVNTSNQTEQLNSQVQNTPITIQDNLSALVNLAIEKSDKLKTGDLSDLQGIGEDEQITLVMADDGTGSYIISHLGKEAVEEVAGAATEEEEGTEYNDRDAEMAISALEKVYQAPPHAASRQTATAVQPNTAAQPGVDRV